MSMTLIQTVTVGAGGAASIDFTSIPQTYTDLVVKVSVRQTTGSFPTLFFYFNGLTTNRSFRSLYGTGSSAISSNGTDAIAGLTTGSSETANTFGSFDIYIPNYAGSTNKSASADGVSENNATTSYQFLVANLWSSTAAITSLTLLTGGTLAQHSSASLYGITKGSGGATVS
jgi:hypothetical protein